MPGTTLGTEDKTANKKEKNSLPVGGDKPWAYVYTKHILYQLVSDKYYGNSRTVMEGWKWQLKEGD